MSVVSEPQDAAASKRPTGRRGLASVRHTAATVPIGDTMGRSAGGWVGWAVTPRNEDGGMRDDTLVIDCGTCSEHGTKTCDDCVVTFLCGRDPEDAVVVDLAEFRAIRMLGDAGLVPPLRHTDSVRAEH